MPAIKTSDLQNIGQLYWATMGRLFKVTAIATRVDDANHFMQDHGGSVITQTENCEVILISDDEVGHKIAFK